jgi:hypothetical protein
MPALVHGVIDQDASKSTQENTETDGEECETYL